MTQAQLHDETYPQAPAPMQYENSRPEYNNHNTPQTAAKTPVYQEPAHELMESQQRAELS